MASLFKFPRIDTPNINMRTPRVTNPDSLLRSGQLWAKYFLKILSSETTRKTKKKVSSGNIQKE